VTTLVSSLLAFLGTILQLTTTNIWLSMLFACFIGIGLRGLFFAATISNLRNFEPKIRGAIMCLLYCVLYLSRHIQQSTASCLQCANSTSPDYRFKYMRDYQRHNRICIPE
jgi:ABC-type uncharacterized transport system permease subunit